MRSAGAGRDIWAHLDPTHIPLSWHHIDAFLRCMRRAGGRWRLRSYWLRMRGVSLGNQHGANVHFRWAARVEEFTGDA